MTFDPIHAGNLDAAFEYINTRYGMYPPDPFEGVDMAKVISNKQVAAEELQAAETRATVETDLNADGVLAAHWRSYAAGYRDAVNVLTGVTDSVDAGSSVEAVPRVDHTVHVEEDVNSQIESGTGIGGRL